MNVPSYIVDESQYLTFPQASFFPFLFSDDLLHSCSLETSNPGDSGGDTPAFALLGRPHCATSEGSI